jgi:adenylate cyclase
VIGRLQPLRIYEPLGPAGQESPVQSAHAQIYAKGLACWRKHEFAGAAELFASIAEVDPPSALFMQRAKNLVLSPPGPDWKPINALEGK